MSCTSVSGPRVVHTGGTVKGSDGQCPTCGSEIRVVATCSAAAEAEQGDGPAAASASASAVSDGIAKTSVVSATVGSHYAAAASDTVAVAVGPYGAAAASPVGVAVVAPDGASATSNAANSSSTSVASGRDGNKPEPAAEDAPV